MATKAIVKATSPRSRPKTLRVCFAAEDRGDWTSDDLSSLLAERWSTLRGQLDDELTIDIERVDCDLQQAWFRFISELYSPWRGSSRLTTGERAWLRRLHRAVEAVERALGPNLREAAHRIGGWVEGSLIPPGGQSLEEWSSGLYVVGTEIGYRLDGAARQPRHRPRLNRRRAFALDVACVLADGGERVTASRRGRFAAVLTVLLRGAEVPAPVDIFRLVKLTADRLREERSARRRAEAHFAEFL